MNTGTHSRERELAALLKWALQNIRLNPYVDAEAFCTTMNKAHELADAVLTDDRQQELDLALDRRQKANTPW